ncbi:MAG: mechanosensitive ion channel family protein [Endomicrobium sp.]|nr:mechanosensitive ion channel family protein [Endomicrobium sp.]
MFSKIGLVLPSNIILTFKNYITFWFFLTALYIAFLNSPINSVNVIIHKIFYGILAFSIVFLIASIFSKLFKNSFHEKISSNIIKFIIISIGLTLILNQIGIRLTPILTALGIGSLAVALALQDTLANFFAGINILACKQIVKNDYIRLNSGQEGTVMEINWRTTIIREMSNTVIVIPNNKISSAIVTSFQYQKAEVSAFVNYTVAYDSDLEYVEKVAKFAAQEIINNHDNTIKTYKPVIYFTNFIDSSITFILFFRVKDVYSKAFIQSEILKNIHKKFNAAKIKIPFPKRVFTVDNGNNDKLLS